MPVLYLTEQGAELHKDGLRLKVEKAGRILAEVPFEQVESVNIFGYLQLSAQVIEVLLEREIETAFFTLNGRLKGQLTPAKAKNAHLRFAQFQKAQEAGAALQIAKIIVQGKIANSQKLMQKFLHNHPGLELNAALTALQEAGVKAEKAGNKEELLGIEGAAARAYFQAFAKMVLNGMQFPGRQKRPPREPVNALLSFGYVLVGSEIQSLLDGLGFDPYIGFFHALDYGRPSLALDLLEEYRAAVVDRFVLYLLNNRILTAEDFENTPEQGVRLKREAGKVFFKEYEKHMNRLFSDPDYEGKQSFRTIFRLQAHRLAAQLTEGKPYQPYTLDI